MRIAQRAGMLAAMPSTGRLTVRGFLVRLAFAPLVVGATYDPTHYSYSIGGLGLLLANAFRASLFWPFADSGWRPIATPS